MKKSIILLLVIGSMFSSLVVSSFIIAPKHVYALTYDSKEIKEAKRESDKEALAKDKADGKAVDEGTTQPKYSEKDIKTVLGANDIDWINKNISKNFTVYYQSGSLTDLGLSSAHLVASLFMSLNLYIIYPLFDTALSKMFDLTNITQGINNIFSNVQQFTKQTWTGAVFKQLLYTAFGLGLVWVFIQSVKSGAGLKAILSVLLVAIIGSTWISAGGTVLTKVNNFTSQAQSAVFTEIDSSDQTYSSTDDFENKIRKTFFEKAVIRPYTLANFGTTNLDASEKDGSYRLIGGKAESDVIDALAKLSDYLSKDGGEEWYQASVGLMAPIMSLAYGVPLLMIGIFNLILQLGAILLYYLSPFTVLLSLLPRFSNSALKTGLSALGLLFAKIGLLFGIMFVSWVGTVTDTIVPVTNSPSALLNSIVYIVLMVLLWKNKSFLVQTVTGSSMANQALNKIQLTQAGQRAMLAGSEMVNSTKHGLENVKGLSGRHAKDKSEDKSNDEHESSNDRRGNVPDDQEMRELEEQRRQERAERLADEAERQRQKDDDEENIDPDHFDDVYTDRRSHGEDDESPTYTRTPYLIKNHDNTDSYGNGSNEPDRSFNCGRVLDDESSEKLAEKRREARSQVLKPSAKPATSKSMIVDDDKLQQRNFDEAVYHQEQITQDEEKELDKEL
ncbi:CD3337/EF1877 family mobilome membrane protein [Leuconostoc citreum]|uniref:ABC-type antimicrobial peptide transport system, permease component n=1 Tax=Leuconostoc citreum (strain KM20) TaxID=349519 RepID=B1MYW8_LEUCK|nr:ABC transporter permease [Leuconostoc citreum]ACA82720.1 ABC-type antimicrobial peptide transport system, permease component [Leuconostoc citreum KM20]